MFGIGAGSGAYRPAEWASTTLMPTAMASPIRPSPFLTWNRVVERLISTIPAASGGNVIGSGGSLTAWRARC